MATCRWALAETNGTYCLRRSEFLHFRVSILTGPEREAETHQFLAQSLVFLTWAVAAPYLLTQDRSAATVRFLAAEVRVVRSNVGLGNTEM